MNIKGRIILKEGKEEEGELSRSGGFYKGKGFKVRLWLMFCRSCEWFM